MSKSRRRRSGGRIGALARAAAADPLLVSTEATLLFALSVADLLLTYTLLRRGTHFEANPIARWWFDRWNMAGLTAFKFLVIGGTILVSEIVERHRPGVGRGVLGIGCVAAAGVVVYSVYLLMRTV